MTLIADILLAAGAFGAAFYCFILSRRLKRFNNLENGMGGAVAVLSAQVDDLERTLAAARTSATQSVEGLERLADRAEDVRRQLEIQIASVHDLVPQAGDAPAATARRPAAPQRPAADLSPEPMFSRRRTG